MPLEHGIMDAAAAQNVGECVSHEFTDPQLALRAGGTVALMMARHLLKPGSVVREAAYDTGNGLSLVEPVTMPAVSGTADR